MINRKFSRYYQKTLARASGKYDCGSAALGYPEKLPKPNRLDFTGFGADSQIEPAHTKYLDI